MTSSIGSSTSTVTSAGPIHEQGLYSIFEVIFSLIFRPAGGPPYLFLMTLLPSEQLNAVERKGLHTMYDNHQKSLI